MKNKHNIFSLNKFALILLIISNFVYGFWLQKQFDSAWGWVISDLAQNRNLIIDDFVAIGQFVLFAITVDMIIRHFVVRFNENTKKQHIPAILVQALTIISYGIIGLFGFIAMYDHSAGQVLAASGAISFGFAYIMRERIADIVASIQIQTDGLISIGDHIEVKGDESYEVMQIDARMVTLKNMAQFINRIPNRRFVNLSFINLSKQYPARGSRRKLEIELDSGNDVTKVIQLLTQSIQFVIKSEPAFINWYSVRLSKINNGTYTFAVSYECAPTLSSGGANGIINATAVRFLKLGGINMNSTVETTRASDVVSSIKDRLKDVYQLSVLGVLSLEQVKQLSESAQIVHCPADKFLIQKGHVADSMYILIEGALEVSIPNEQGEQMVVAAIWPGECVGEMSLLTGEVRSADVRAKINSTLLEITKNDIAPIFESNPEVIDEISTLLEKRREHNQMMLNKTVKSEETQANIKNLAKKILKFFFNKN